MLSPLLMSLPLRVMRCRHADAAMLIIFSMPR